MSVKVFLQCNTVTRSFADVTPGAPSARFRRTPEAPVAPLIHQAFLIAFTLLQPKRPMLWIAGIGMGRPSGQGTLPCARVTGWATGASQNAMGP